MHTVEPLFECSNCGALAPVRQIGRLASGDLLCRDCVEYVTQSLGFMAHRYGLTSSAPSGGSISRALRVQIHERDSYRCRYCGGFAGGLSLDHVLPQSRGGLHTADNLVTACTPCNSRKHDKTPDEAGMQIIPLAGDRA